MCFQIPIYVFSHIRISGHIFGPGNITHLLGFEFPYIMMLLMEESYEIKKICTDELVSVLRRVTLPLTAPFSFSHIRFHGKVVAEMIKCHGRVSLSCWTYSLSHNAFEFNLDIFKWPPTSTIQLRKHKQKYSDRIADSTNPNMKSNLFLSDF